MRATDSLFIRLDYKVGPVKMINLRYVTSVELQENVIVLHTKTNIFWIRPDEITNYEETQAILFRLTLS
jgi:hypothetical protein